MKHKQLHTNHLSNIYINKFIDDTKKIGKTLILSYNDYLKFNFSKNISNKYKTIILINVLNKVVDYEDTLFKFADFVKVGGRIIGTVSSFAEIDDNNWGFTSESVRYLLDKIVGIKNRKVHTFGNVLAGRYLLNNKIKEDINNELIFKTDKHFPVIIGFSFDKKSLNIGIKNIQKNIIVDEEKSTLRGYVASLLKRSNIYLDKYINIARAIRSKIVRLFYSSQKYLNSNSTEPISKIYGFDRGVPVDRYYIEKFIHMNKHLIKGRCLEVVDNQYTVKFGGKNVTVSDVLDIFPSKKANIKGDLRNLVNIKSNTYDTLIITQTYNVIDDYLSAIKESHRILKKGGILLVTLPTISPCWNISINMWRFSRWSLFYILNKFFSSKNIITKSLGGAKSTEGFWVGLSQEDLGKSELNSRLDNGYLIIGAVAKK